MCANILRRLALASALVSAGAASAQQVEHTFIFVIDGVRASEGFDDPSHLYVSALYDDLAPQGSLLTNMEVRDQPVTVPAHQSLISGTWADYANLSPYEEREYFAQRFPTLFESYRMQTGAPADSCWLVGNTPLIHDSAHSLMPGYGGDYAARRALDYGGHEQDSFTWDGLETAMADGEVALALINLHEVDRHGHSDSWLGYSSKIEEGSENIVEFWTRIQIDPVYQDNTLLIVTTDHGRHDDGVLSGWIDHGCSCRGCRQVFLLAIGPGIRQGFVSDEPVSFLDIAPTVAHVMGVDFPYHRGRILTEILMAGASVEQGPGGLGSFNPWTVSRDGLTVRVSEKQDPDVLDSQGAQLVNTEISEDGGESWDEYSTAGNPTIQLAPVAWTDGEIVLVGWQELPTGGEEWSVRLRRLGGESADWEEVLFEPMDGSATPVSNLALTESDGELYLAEMNSRQETLRMWSSDDRGLSWSEDLINYTIDRYFPRDVDAERIDGTWVVSYSAHAEGPPNLDDNNDNTEIYWIVSDDEGDTWEGEHRLTDDDAPSIQPELALTPDGVLHLIWADMEEGSFQLYHAESTDEGATFSVPTQLTFDSLGAWEPAAAVDGERLYIAWSQFDAVDEATVHLAALEDDALVEERVLGGDAALARTPHLAPLGDCTSLLTWSHSDLDDGWELSSSVLTTAGVPVAGATGSLAPDSVVAGSTTLLQLTIDLSVDDENRGTDRVEVGVPSGLSANGTAELTVDGDAVEGTASIEGTTLWFELAEPVTEDGAQLVLGFEVDVQAEPFDGAEFTVILHDGTEPCPVSVQGSFTISAEAFGDDDDSATGDDGDCSCSAVGGGEHAALIVLLLFGAFHGTRRTRP